MNILKHVKEVSLQRKYLVEEVLELLKPENRPETSRDRRKDDYPIADSY